MDLMTTIEPTGVTVDEDLEYAEPGDAYYVWEVPGLAASHEIEGDDDGWWSTPEEAYADLQAWLRRMPDYAVMPSTAKIELWFMSVPTVTHVVRIG